MLLLALAIFLIPNKTISVFAPTAEAKEVLPKVWDRETIDQLISEKASKYQVSESLMRHIVLKESTYNIRNVGDVNYVCKSTGKVSPSYGLVQINLCWHNITTEQAFDPEFAIEFLAENLSKGRCKRLWSTCPL
jgi:soluble lytic murein transglycosylase-like protein